MLGDTSLLSPEKQKQMDELFMTGQYGNITIIPYDTIIMNPALSQINNINPIYVSSVGSAPGI